MPRSKKCVFCGGYPLSKEHVLGKWLSGVVATPPPGKKLYIDSERTHAGVDVHHPRRFPKEIDIQVRCVCVSCNNGWMEAMESEVKPIIESLLTGDNRTLDESDQFSLAKWAVKTAIIGRYFGGQHEVPTMYRKWFYQHKRVPPNTYVWMGTYEDDLAVSFETKDMSFLDLNGHTLGFPHSQFVVFTTGRVLIAVLTAYIASTVSIENRGAIKEHLRIISPFSDDFIWPWNPLDKAGRLAIANLNWDGELLLEARTNESPPSE